MNYAYLSLSLYLQSEADGKILKFIFFGVYPGKYEGTYINVCMYTCMYVCDDIVQ